MYLSIYSTQCIFQPLLVYKPGFNMDKYSTTRNVVALNAMLAEVHGVYVHTY